MSEQSKLDFFRRLEMFKEISLEDMEAIVAKSWRRQYPKQTFLFLEGDPGDYYYVIESGQVKLSVNFEEHEKIIGILTGGEFFPEVIMDGGSYPVSAQCIPKTTVYLLRRDELLELMDKYPAIQRMMVGMVCKNLRRAYRQIRNLSTKTAHQRVASRIYSLAKAFGEQTEAGITIKVPLTTDELAKLVGTARETANRILGDLRKDKAISVESQLITITDMEKLKSWL
ncbi:MAG: Crp/Fnr family transcriptional regulator [Thermincolia bacterium]